MSYHKPTEGDCKSFLQERDGPLLTETSARNPEPFLSPPFCFARALPDPEGISPAPALQTQLTASYASHTAACWQSRGEDYSPGFEHRTVGAALLCTDGPLWAGEFHTNRGLQSTAPCAEELAKLQREGC